MHRLFHLPSIGLGKIEHYADDHADCLNLAKNNATFAPYNTHSLQYFANHVYAVEVAQGGEACVGEYEGAAAIAPASSSSAAPTATAAGAASGTSSAAASCRESTCTTVHSEHRLIVIRLSSLDTHSDGEVHCV